MSWASIRGFVLGGVIATSALWPAVAIAPVTANSSASSYTKPCTALTNSPRRPPATIRIWVPHLHRIWRPTLREYILRVMSAGAAPTWLPDESLRVMALGIYQYTMYEVMHPSEKKRKRAGCYDLKNGGSEGQYVWPYSGLRPYTPKQEQALDDVWGITVWKPHRGHWWYPRLGWLDGYGGKCGTGVDGWHLPEDEITDCAKEGFGWRKILSMYLAPMKVKEQIPM